MNLNTQFFSAYNHRHRQPTAGYRSPLHDQQASILKNVQTSFTRSDASESFLPSITTMNGQKPYRRNDFANNHLFIAKQNLARIFLNQSTMDIQARNRRIKKTKRNEDNSHSTILEQDVHLSVVNLIIKPSLPSIHTRDQLTKISHHHGQAANCQTKAARSSVIWINPAMNEQIRSTTVNDLEPYIIINELTDNNPSLITNSTNPFHSSLLYVKSIITSAESPNH